MFPHLRGIQKAKVLVPGNVDEDPQAILGGEVQKPFAGHMVNPDQVGSERANLSEIPRRLLWRRKWLARRVRRERAISEAFDVKFCFAYPEEFATYAHAGARGSGHCHEL